MTIGGLNIQSEAGRLWSASLETGANVSNTRVIETLVYAGLSNGNAKRQGHSLRCIFP